MSEIDNLESLSNADLRKQCIKHGLPNVPITDSSRNVLIKKLRASLSGSPAAQTKKTPRRETIHVTKTTEAVEAQEVKVEPERRTPSRGANRRTFAGTATIETQKASESLAPESLTPAPIGARRRSTRDHDIPPPAQKEQRPTKIYNPIVILESDEEDKDLLLAAEQVEQRSKSSVTPEEANVRSRSSRSVSLSKTSVVTTAYSQPTVKPIVEEPQVPIRKEVSESTTHEIYKPQMTANSGRFSLHSNLMQRNTGISKELPKTVHSRYSTNTLTSALYTSKAAPLYNEQSDDNEETPQDYETPFLSSFARNLERLKTDGAVLNKQSSVGGIDMGRDYTSPRPIQSTRRYEITGRRPATVSVTNSFRQLLIALDRKYNLRLYLVLVTVFLIMAFIFVIVYQ